MCNERMLCISREPNFEVLNTGIFHMKMHYYLISIRFYIPYLPIQTTTIIIGLMCKQLQSFHLMEVEILLKYSYVNILTSRAETNGPKEEILFLKSPALSEVTPPLSEVTTHQPNTQFNGKYITVRSHPTTVRSHPGHGVTSDTYIYANYIYKSGPIFFKHLSVCRYVLELPIHTHMYRIEL